MKAITVINKMDRALQFAGSLQTWSSEDSGNIDYRHTLIFQEANEALKQYRKQRKARKGKV